MRREVHRIAAGFERTERKPPLFIDAPVLAARRVRGHHGLETRWTELGAARELNGPEHPGLFCDHKIYPAPREIALLPVLDASHITGNLLVLAAAEYRRLKTQREI